MKQPSASELSTASGSEPRSDAMRGCDSTGWIAAAAGADGGGRPADGPAARRPHTCRRSVRISVSASTGLVTAPSMPAASNARRSSSAALAVSATTGVREAAPGSRRIARVASVPDMPGMKMSISTMS